MAKVGQDTRLFTYDEAGHLIGEYTATGQAIQEHIWMGDIPLAVVDANGAKFVFSDQINTPRGIIDVSGKVLWKWDGEAFGLSTPNENPSGSGTNFTYNLRFPGQYFDTESGLDYNWNRYYDPSTGRYTSSDPIGLKGGMHTYLYAGGNPLLRTDSMGLTSKNWTCSWEGPVYVCIESKDSNGGGGPLLPPNSGGKPSQSFGDFCQGAVDGAKNLWNILTGTKSEEKKAEACQKEWEEDLAWCDGRWSRNSRKGEACHRWAEGNYGRCLKDESREPWRL